MFWALHPDARRRAVLLIVLAALAAPTAARKPLPGGAKNAPTDNPIAAAYGADAYPWTNKIRWDNVFDILDYGGAPDGETPNDVAFAAARDAASKSGGGVVYFPPGTYRFTDHIYLKDGVVLRGESSQNSDARSDDYQPPLSRLLFPRYVPSFEGDGTPDETAFKKIFARSPQTDSNLGLVNLDINRAGIKIGGDPNTSRNRNHVVFGTRTNNAGSPDDSIPRRTITFSDTGETVPFQHGWQRWHNRFETNIRVGVFENALVANNRINDNPTDDFEQIGYVIRDSTSGTPRSTDRLVALDRPGQAVFRHTDQAGMVINDAPHPWYATPETAPGLFREGIVVRDNRVYHTMRNGIKANGRGLVVQDNLVLDDPNKTATVFPTGQHRPTGSVTYENRGIHVSGRDILTENNSVRVYTHRLLNANGSAQGYNSNDGEGLLQDNTGTVVDGWTVRGNDVNSYIGVYRPRDIHNVTITGNTVTNRSGTPTGNSIWVWADAEGRAYSLNNVLIRNNSVQGGITLIGGAGGEGNAVHNNAGSGGAVSVAPGRTFTGTSLGENTGFVPVAPGGLTQDDLSSTSVTLSWGDASDRGVDETGYQILRNNAPLAGATTGPDETRITLTGLAPNTEYRLKVRAFNANGNGAASSEVRVRTPR